MRKREFVGIAVIGGIICFICFLFGRKLLTKEIGSKKNNESSESV